MSYSTHRHPNFDTLNRHNIWFHHYNCTFLLVYDILNFDHHIELNAKLYRLWKQINTISTLLVAGVVHRDIKSDNILINPENLEVKLLDFGLALCVDDLEEYELFEVEYIGTPIYMSPAVLSASGYHSPIASDVWSAGVVFLEALSGFQPFAELTSRAALLSIVNNPGWSRSWVRYPLPCQLILKAILEPNDEDRASLSELAVFIQDALSSPSIQTGLSRSGRARLSSH